MSLAAAARANNLSQLNTVTEIKYSSHNNTIRDHFVIDRPRSTRSTDG